jgi:hydrogenase expression/formation protein HypD
VTGQNTNEFGDLLARVAEWKGAPLTFMEVCGTHTVSAARSGLYALLPKNVRLISGPGCPVCVTPVGFVDHALALSLLPQLTVATFGDLIRVPGSPENRASKQARSLAWARASGADIRVVYSPRDAVQLARTLVDRQVVFLSVGFETTTPTVAAAICQAAKEGLTNFSVLTANKTVIEALVALSTSEDCAINGFMLPGHVSVIIGSDCYQPIVDRFHLPCAIAGFEPVEMVRAIASLTGQVAQAAPRVDNCYRGPVAPAGNGKARALMYEVFEACDSVWRGLGNIGQSGLKLRDAYAQFDAARRFTVSVPPPIEPPGCRCGDVLRGTIMPSACPLFGRACTPDDPKGACMVSSEGSCAAHYSYGT